jgi:hypothetical protein
MDNNSYLVTILVEIQKSYLENMSGFFLIAKVIASIGLLISAYFAYFDIMASGDNEAIKKFFRKFLLIFLGIFYYATFIQFINAPLDAVINGIRETTIIDTKYNNDTSLPGSDLMGPNILNQASNPNQTNSEKNNSAEMNKKILSYLKGEKNDENTTEDDSDFFTSVLSYGTNIAMNSITSWFLNIITLIAEVANMILSVIRGFYLIILTIFGIFVIAISSFPTFENSFTQWITKYINVYLWLGIAFVLQGIMQRLQTMLIDRPVDELHAQANVYSVLIGLCTIIGYLAIPSISSWLVNASTNQVSGKMGSVAQMAAKKIVTKGAA